MAFPKLPSILVAAGDDRAPAVVVIIKRSRHSTRDAVIATDLRENLMLCVLTEASSKNLAMGTWNQLSLQMSNGSFEGLAISGYGVMPWWT